MVNCTEGFPLVKREKQQNVLDVAYGISGRNSDATLREALEDFYMISNSSDIRKEMGGPIHFSCEHIILELIFRISINNTHQYFSFPSQKH